LRGPFEADINALYKAIYGSLSAYEQIASQVHPGSG
jgi:hypothetical protein